MARQGGLQAHRLRSPARRATTDALDRCVQERFRDDTKTFGISRMVVAPNHFRGFDPETPAEAAALSRLKAEGIRMAFYLGSRQGMALDENRPPAEEGGFTDTDDPEGEPMNPHPPVSFPVFITDPNELAKLPWPRDLHADARKALAAFEARDSSYASKLGPWTIEARPIRASRKSCLGCHTVERKPIPGGKEGEFSEKPLKIGDTLGIAFYLFNRR